MPDVNLLAVLVAGVVVLVIGGVYYGVLGSHLAPVGEARPGWQVPVVELARGLVLAAVVAGLATYADIAHRRRRPRPRAGPLGRVPGRAVDRCGVPRTGADPAGPPVHAGDWLAKLLVVGRDRRRLAVGL